MCVYMYVYTCAPSNLEEAEGHEEDLDDGSHVRRDHRARPEERGQVPCSFIPTFSSGDTNPLWGYNPFAFAPISREKERQRERTSASTTACGGGKGVGCHIRSSPYRCKCNHVWICLNNIL